MNAKEALIMAKRGAKVRPKSWSGFTEKLYIYYDSVVKIYRVYVYNNSHSGFRLKIDPEWLFEEWEECNFMDIYIKKRGA